MNAFRLFIAVVMLSHASGNDSPQAAANGTLVLEGCHVRVQDEAEIPAPEAGVLIKLSVKDGSRVAEGDVLATIDDREARARLNIAAFGLQAAIERANNKVEEKYAKKASEFAKVDWMKAQDANRRTPDSVAEMEVLSKKLAFERAELQIEKSQKDRELARLEALTKMAERDAAKMQLEWRTILAPFGGEVVSTMKHQAEWVQPGEPILRLVRYNNLYVEGVVNVNQFDRSDLLGRDVTVEAPRTRGRSATVTGKIVYAEQEVSHKGDFIVRAEVKNELENDSWLIQPGVQAKMTILLSSEPRAQSPEAETARR